MHYFRERFNQISQLLWRLTFETLFHLRLHAFIHLDEREPSLSESFGLTRRPVAFEGFAGKFLGRVNAEPAAAGDFAGRVVEDIGRVFGEENVPSLPRLRRAILRRPISALALPSAFSAPSLHRHA